MTLEARLDKGYTLLLALMLAVIIVAIHFSPERGNSCVNNGAGPVPSFLGSGSDKSLQERRSALPQNTKEVMPNGSPGYKPCGRAHVARPASIDGGVLGDEAGLLPQDSFQRCATKALRGDFGKLQPWQHDAYRKAVDRGATVCGKAWVTNYGPNEGRQGQIDSKGSPCTTRTAAANRIKRGSYVWVAQTKGGGATIRQVLDCGAKYNDNVARGKGADLWIDIWVPWAGNWSTICDYTVIGGNNGQG